MLGTLWDRVKNLHAKLISLVFILNQKANRTLITYKLIQKVKSDVVTKNTGRNKGQFPNKRKTIKCY